MRSIIGASDKLKGIIRMSFNDAELAQGRPILRLHDPYDFAFFERVLGGPELSVGETRKMHSHWCFFFFF